MSGTAPMASACSIISSPPCLAGDDVDVVEGVHQAARRRRTTPRDGVAILLTRS
jgi:hypothetical protein